MHARKDSNNICTRMGEHKIFSEHHQDPPGDLENYSYDEQGGLGEDNSWLGQGVNNMQKIDAMHSEEGEPIKHGKGTRSPQ